MGKRLESRDPTARPSNECAGLATFPCHSLRVDDHSLVRTGPLADRQPGRRAGLGGRVRRRNIGAIARTKASRTEQAIPGGDELREARAVAGAQQHRVMTVLEGARLASWV